MMLIEFTEKCKIILKSMIGKMNGSERRKVLAEFAEEYGKGGQRYVEKEFKISHNTLKKGKFENQSGIDCVDAFNMRGRKPITEKLPSTRKRLRRIKTPKA